MLLVTTLGLDLDAQVLASVALIKHFISRSQSCKEKGETERETTCSPSGDKQWQGGNGSQIVLAPPAVIYVPDLSRDICCSAIKLSCSHLESPPSLALESTEKKQLL